MPYKCVLNGRKWDLQKADGSKTFGSHSTKGACIKQQRALYAHTMDSQDSIKINEFLMRPMDFENKIKNAIEAVNVVVNGRGGDTIEALNIHNALRAAGKKIVTYIPTMALSAHAIVALAGDEIYMAENATMMFHSPKAIPGDNLKTSEELKSLAAGLDALEIALVNTLMAKTKKSEAECKAIMSKDTWLSAQQAFDCGIVTEVIPIMRNIVIEDYFPVEIVNYVKGKQQMPLKEICDQFGVEATTDNAEDRLVEFINGLRKQIPSKPMDIPPAMVNMAKRMRETELNILVQTGKAVPAVVDPLKLKFMDETRIKTDLQTENKEFESIVDSFAKNEVVMSFGGQKPTKTIPNNPPEDNPLIKHAEQLAKQAMKA